MFFSFKFLTLMDCVMELLEHILDFFKCNFVKSQCQWHKKISINSFDFELLTLSLNCVNETSAKTAKNLVPITKD